MLGEWKRIRPGRPGVLIVSVLSLSLGGCVNNPGGVDVPAAAPSTFASASSAAALAPEHLERRGWVSEGDLDGDGASDPIVIQPRRADDQVDVTNPARLLVLLASGGQVASGGLLTDPGVRLLGTYDVDGDGKEELFVRSGGETQSVGLLVSLVDGDLRLVKVQKPNGDSKRFSYVFAVHSNANPMATLDVACVTVDDTRLLRVASVRLVGGPFANVTEMKRASRRWSLATYEFVDGLLTPVANESGIVEPNQPVPRPVPTDNMLRCGSPDSGAVAAN